MHIISRKRLREFGALWRDATKPLDDWYRIAKRQVFASYSEVKSVFGAKVDLIGDYTCFDIGGNKYRLITIIRYVQKRIFVRHVFTHKEYDEWNEQQRKK